VGDVAEVAGADGVAVAERDRGVRDHDEADARVAIGTGVEGDRDLARELDRGLAGGRLAVVVGERARPQRQVAALDGGRVAGGVE
jgi:hypothetical protein